MSDRCHRTIEAYSSSGRCDRHYDNLGDSLCDSARDSIVGSDRLNLTPIPPLFSVRGCAQASSSACMYMYI